MLMLVFSSCKNQQESSFAFDYNKEKIRHAFQMHNLIEAIADCGEVSGSYLGALGIKSEPYQLFLQLKQTASNSELLELINNDYNVTVKAYSFIILAERRSVYLNNISQHVVSDSSTFNYSIGCFVTEEKLNAFYKEVANEFLSNEVLNGYNNNKKYSLLFAGL